MSRYWPAIMPSVAFASSRATAPLSYVERQSERLREERVAREQRDALSEGDMGAGATAPLVVVVQRREVVVHEREGVHELEGSSRGKRVVDRCRRSLRPRRRRAPGEPACRPTPASSGAPPRGLRAPVRTSASRGTPRRRRGARQPCRIGEVPRLRELALDLPRELGELGDEIDRGVAVHVVGAQRAARAPRAARSGVPSSSSARASASSTGVMRPPARARRARASPLTSRAASSVA